MNSLFLNVQDQPFNAKGNGIDDDTQAIQDAIDKAKSLSVPGATNAGAIVLLPPGEYLINKPLILPASGNNGYIAVHLMGHPRSSRLKGTSNFPPCAGLIEWEQTPKVPIPGETGPARALAQRITGLEFNLPLVDGVKAIYRRWDRQLFPSNDTKDERDRAVFEQQRSRLQIHLEDLVINGSNTHHESLLRFEGSVIQSTIRNVHASCGRGLNPKYSSILLHFDDGEDLVKAYPPSWYIYAFDNVGFQYGHIENVETNFYGRGGFHSLFRGRLNRSTIIGAHAAGGSRNTPAFDFYNSFENELINISTEGTAEKPIYKLKNCHGITFRKIGIGTPTPAPTGTKDSNGNDQYYPDTAPGIRDGSDLIGNGIELYNCTDCVFESRTTAPNVATFKTRVSDLKKSRPNMREPGTNGQPKQIYLVKLDSQCQRNIFRGFHINAQTPADEFLLEGDSSKYNSINGFNHRSKTSFRVGQWSQP